MSAAVKPWNPALTRPGYDWSILDMPSPGYFTGEVMLGSAYRALLLGVSESDVNLELLPSLPGRLAVPTAINSTVWERILLGGPDSLASPQPRGRSSRGSSLPQVSPLVPELASHGCVIGTVRSRENPANLLFVTILRGLGESGARTLLKRLAQSLSVEANDDIFARFIEENLRKVSGSQLRNPPPAPGVLTRDKDVNRYFEISGDAVRVSPVAAIFARDLGTILSLKPRLTRRQWTVLLETMIRLGLGTQVLWTCRTTEGVWRYATEVLEGHGPPPIDRIRKELWESHVARDPLLEIGPGVGPAVRNRLGRYARARVGLNSVLFGLETSGHPWTSPIGIPSVGHSSEEAILSFLIHLDANRGLMGTTPIADAAGIPPGWVNCTSGFTRNFWFFLVYGMGRLRPADTFFQGYDQSYILAKKRDAQTPAGKIDRSPWIFRLGPSALVALVHACCQSEAALHATMDDFRRLLSGYGILADGDELKNGTLGTDLQRLGLVIDSPDGGGGRLLVDPMGGHA